MPNTAIANNPAARETALLIPGAIPTRFSETAFITVVVNGATLRAMPRPSTTVAGKKPVQYVAPTPGRAKSANPAAATGPSSHKVQGNEIVFEPLAKLAPRADAIYRVTVKCTSPGIAKFQARLTSAILTEPVTKEELSRVVPDVRDCDREPTPAQLSSNMLSNPPRLTFSRCI